VSAFPGRIAIVGGSGQLARALAAGARLQGLDAVTLCRPHIDLERPQTLAPALDAARPVLVINAAAFTAVDQAESQEARALMVNAAAPAEMARWCAASSAWLLHVSTDYVFDGSASSPYPPDHPARPLNAYGRTKAAGEALIRAGLARHLIVRTAWLYDATGRNFLTTMLGLAAGRDEITVVADQKSAPTYAADLATGLLAMAARVLAAPADAPSGTFHLTGAGQTSWYGFAEAIFAAWAARGHKAPRLTPTTTARWPTPARRPLYSVLDCTATAGTFAIALPHWRDGLERCFAARDRA
jgi:dTDP-4-dehydrorhamnose reductase